MEVEEGGGRGIVKTRRMRKGERGKGRDEKEEKGGEDGDRKKKKGVEVEKEEEEAVKKEELNKKAGMRKGKKGTWKR